MTKETIFYSRLKDQITMMGTSFNQVERDLGYPRNSLNNYKSGTDPSGIRLIELADYFRVSPGFLIGKKNNTYSLKENFQNLDFEQKRELYTICESWAVSQIFKNNLRTQ